MHLRRWLSTLTVGAVGAAPIAVRAQQPSAAPAPRRATTSDSATGVARGTVIDGLTGTPLGSAGVQFVTVVNDAPTGRAFSATADSAGRYEITGLPHGKYVVGFFHPVLDSIRIEPPLRVTDIARPVTRVELSTPSGTALLEAFCGPAAEADSSGMLLGWVYDAETRRPAPGSSVLVTWRELVVDARGMRLEHRRGSATPDSAGFYALCGLPAQLELLATADVGRRHTGLVAVTLRPRGVIRRNFAIADSATPLVASAETATPPGAARAARAPGQARVTGRVLNAHGKPVANARVTVWGTAAEGTTSEGGNFGLATLPAGTYTLEVRALGYAPAHVPVDLARGKTTPVAVTLNEAATVLAPVTVLGKPDRRARDITGFQERRRHGQGRYVTREDLERRNPTYVTDVLTTMPGLRVTPGPRGERAILGRGGCQPTLILDGMAIMQGSESLDALVRPGDVAGIEVYVNSATAPVQYSVHDTGCGMIVVWTGR